MGTIRFLQGSIKSSVPYCNVHHIEWRIPAEVGVVILMPGSLSVGWILVEQGGEGRTFIPTMVEDVPHPEAPIHIHPSIRGDKLEVDGLDVEANLYRIWGPVRNPEHPNQNVTWEWWELPLDTTEVQLAWDDQQGWLLNDCKGTRFRAKVHYPHNQLKGETLS